MKADKRGGFELSVTTLVIIVIAVVLLILGLTLIRNIFKGATESATILNRQVREHIRSMFEQEGRSVAFYQRKVVVKAGSESFSIPVGIKNSEGPISEIYFKVTLLETENLPCENFEQYVISPRLDFCSQGFTWREANEGGIDIILSVPKGTRRCFEMIMVEAYKDSQCSRDDFVGSDTVTIEIVS